MNLSIWGPIIGGCIAATAGIIAQFIASKLEERRKRKSWERRLERLLDRLSVDGKVEEMSDTDAKEYLNVYAEVLPLLEDHMASAPEGVSEDVFGAYEKLYRTRTGLGSNLRKVEEEGRPAVRGISNKARKLQSAVKNDN